MKKKKKATKTKSSKAIKNAAKKKAAARKSITRSASPDCECRQAASGKWFRFIRDTGKKRRIPPGFDSQEECEENCEG